MYKRQVQDQIWNRVTINRAEKKSTRYYMDEFHLLLKEEQTAAYSVETVSYTHLLLAQMKKQHDKQKIPHGKQTLKQLMKQNAGVSNIEITKDNIKAFESCLLYTSPIISFKFL